MKKNHRKNKYFGMIRICTVLLSLVLQIIMIAGLIVYLQQYAIGVYLAIELFSVIVVFGLVSEDDYNRQFWILIIMVLPGFGFILYYLWGSQAKDHKLHGRMRRIEKTMMDQLKQSPETREAFENAHPNKVQISRYLQRVGYPVYQDTEVRYYPLGDDMEPDFMEDLRNAKESIFMEYFIVYNGDWWNRIKEILIQKAAEGVDVRILVDDFGSLFLEVRKLKKEFGRVGIKLCAFAPLEQRVSSLSFNYRNHQKITIIDSTIGYTGGINLADEYINCLNRFGHWKDSAVRLEGAAVISLTNIFLTMWQSASFRKEEKPEQYLPKWNAKGNGFVQPFAGGPHRNRENPVCGVYCRMINKARDYIYITTPYLVLDYRLREQLIQAVESGVDVRIITPGRYDKWYVYMVTISNYGKLLKKGVRIYQYAPGFIHAKNVVVDDECAVCGTINLDCRSLYLHYENGVFLGDSSAVLEIKQDFIKTLDQCREIDLAAWKKRPLWQKLVQWVLRVLSPLL